jgi:hypothetical protein
MKMTRAALALGLCLTITSFSSAYPCSQATAFEVSYESSLFPALLPVEIHPTDDGGFLLAAVGRPQPSNDRSLLGEHVLAKFDANGVREWELVRPDLVGVDHLQSTAERIAIDVDPAGDIYLLEPSAGASNLVKLDAAGTILWEASAGFGSEGTAVATHLDASVQGEVIVAGYYFALLLYTPWFAQSFNSGGNVQWSRTGNYCTPLGLTRGPQGRIFLWGRYDTLSIDAGSIQVVALEANGDTHWVNGLFQTSFPDPVADYRTIGAAVDSMGEFTLLAGARTSLSSELVLQRIDASGNEVLQARPLDGTGRTVYPTSLALDPNGGYYVTAGLTSPTCGSLAPGFSVLKFDRSGNWTGTLTPSALGNCEVSQAERMVVAADGSVTAIGTIDGGGENMFAARFDASGVETMARRWAGRFIPNLDLTPTGLYDTGPRITQDVRGNALTATAENISGTDAAVNLVKVVEGTAGAPYCGPAAPNSTGSPSQLGALGSSDVAVNNVSLVAEQLPPGSFVLFLASRTQGFTPAASGQGTLCLGGSVGRYVGPRQVQSANSGGRANLQLELTGIPQPNGPAVALPGETWNFQAWYRDANPGVTSNFTDGVSVQL